MLTNIPVCRIYVDILENNVVMRKLREVVPTEEFDYGTLLSCLKNYRSPRDKITRLIRSGKIIRVKKGIYVFGKEYRRHPVCKESLANIIYGPSYVSLEYALSYYGIIPERVEWVTSMTSQKSKVVESPLGIFSYKKIALHKFNVGVNHIAFDEKHSVFFASPEKALVDKITTACRIDSVKELSYYLYDDLRIDEEDIIKLSHLNFQKIAALYHSHNIKFLMELING